MPETDADVGDEPVDPTERLDRLRHQSSARVGVADKFVDDSTWAALAASWNQQQLMDIVFTVGQYTLVSMALNTFGVQIEDDTEQFPPELFCEGRFAA